MTISKLRLTTIMAALALTLAACGAGGGGDENTERYSSTNTPPIKGMTWEGAAQAGIEKDAEKELDFVTQDVGGVYTRKATITLKDGRTYTDGKPAGDQQVILRRWLDRDGTVQGEDTYRTTYIPGYNETPDRAANVDEVIVNGQKMRYAHTDYVDELTGETTGYTENFVYLPADANSETYAGMMQYRDTYGIFGDRTTAEQVAQQRGTATYKGVTHGSAMHANADDQNGEFIGTASATVNFDSAGGPSLTTSGRANQVGGDHRTTTYSVTGSIAQDGRLTGTSGTLNGKTATKVDLNGGLYGSNAQTMGYTYILENDDKAIGAAILNRD